MRDLKITSYTFLAALLVVLSSCSGVSVKTGDNFDVVELPDGSIVYMNHNSSIAFDEGFSPRSVDVDGEVFLSVVKDETPFVVKSTHADISVLGTEFNVKSRAEELKVEVEEGVVELKTKAKSEKIRRGEAVIYKEAANDFKKVSAEFHFKIWMKELKLEFRKLGKEVKTYSKEIGKESKKAGKQLKEGLKKLK